MAHQGPTLPRPPPTKALLRTTACQDASLNGRTVGWPPHGSNPPTWRSQARLTTAFPHSSRESPNSRGPSWPPASDYSQAMPLPASTPHLSALVHLTHTTVSAGNPCKLPNMLLRLDRYMPLHGDSFSCHFRTHPQFQQSSVRGKEARRRGDSWQHRRRASDQGSAKPHWRRQRRRITDSHKGRKALTYFTNNTHL